MSKFWEEIGLKKFLSAFFVIGGLLPITILSLTLLAISSSTIKSQLEEASHEQSHLIAERVSEHLRRPLKALTSLKSEIEKGTDLDTPFIVNHLNSIVASHEYIKAIQIIDRTGKLRALSPPNQMLLGGDLSQRRFVIEARKKERPYWSPSFISRQFNIPVSTVSIATSGVVISATLSLESIEELAAHLDKNSASQITVTDQNGVFLTHSDQLKAKSRETDPLFLADKQKHNLETVHRGMHHIREMTDRFLRHTVFIEDIGWKITVLRPREHIEQPIIIMISWSASITFVIILIIFILTQKSSAVINASISQLTGAATAFSQGKYEREVPHIGIRELSYLGSSLTDMAKKIEQREGELRQYREHLEEIVAMRTKQLNDSQNELLEYANQAGKAEIATGVLHNIGNILTSTLVLSGVHKQKVLNDLPEKTQKITNLLEEHDENLQTFLFETQKGAAIIEYFKKLPASLKAQREDYLKDVNGTLESLSLIRESVAAQQAYAKQIHFEQKLLIAEEIEKMITLERPMLLKYRIEIQTDFVVRPNILANRSKLLNAIVNFINNSRDSVVEAGIENPTITISLRPLENGDIQIAVSDNGLGMEEKTIKKMFNYGFTTKNKGHGFGLHQTANNIKSMGGSIEAKSAGLHKGATLIITLPATRIMEQNAETPAGDFKCSF